jgi:hypothetical protein
MTTEPTAPTGQLGTIVSWRVPSNVAYELLQTSLGDAGFDAEMAGELQPAHALSRAFNEMRKGRVIRKTGRDGDAIGFQFTKEWLDDHAKEVHYDKEAQLFMDAKTGAVTCPDNADIAELARKLMTEHHAKRMTSDLTRLLHRIYASFRADLIPIREQGGAYFVPDIHSDLVNRTKKLLDSIGGNLRRFDVRLGSDETAESVANSMSEYLTSLLEEFKEACDGVTGDSRKDVIEHRVETIGELRRKLDLYRGLLGGYAEAITERVEKSEMDLMRSLAERTKDTPAS